MKDIALITGASSGIGREMAFVAAAEGHNIALVARSKDELQKTAEELKSRFDIETKVVVADLSVPGKAEEVYKKIAKNYRVNTLINNAGFGDLRLLHEANLEKLQAMIDLNVRALTTLSQLAAVDMAARKSGAIMNVASTAGFFPGPNMAVYYATKNYVLAFSEALHQELKPMDVKVTALCPGPTQSQFSQNADIKNKAMFSQESKLPTAEEVARFGWKKLNSNSAVAVHGFKNKIATQLPRLLPRTVIRRAVTRTQG